MKHIEDDLQIACITWFRLQFPNILIHHSPNGGFRDAREAARFKKMGTLAGFPDLIILCPSNEEFSHALFIELKSAKGLQTQSQKEFQQKVITFGYAYRIIRSLDEFMELVNRYLKNNN